jgi:hypothetical protein
MKISGRVLSSVLNRSILLAILLAVTSVTSVLQYQTASAAQITARKLTLGSSTFNASTTYAFSFTVPTTATVLQSASFTACTTASGACVMPTGFVSTGSSLTGQPVNLGDASGWTVNNATSGSLRLKKTGNSATPTGAQTVSFSSVVNPTAVNTTFFLRIVTYSDDAWTTPVDAGTVAASTARAIVLDGTMPESLFFCTGATITTSGGVPDCTTATVGTVSFNQEFSPAATAVASSQMAASTNAGFGYVITINGPTLTSGGNTIPPMSSATTSTFGVGQFGMNLVVNTTPVIGTAIAPTSNTTNFRALPATGYGTANTFKFTPSGDTIARSDNNTPGSPAATDAQIITASYIVNVTGSQPAGNYVSTLIYICTPTY